MAGVAAGEHAGDSDTTVLAAVSLRPRAGAYARVLSRAADRMKDAS
jgi:hypothetical protein